MMGKTQSMIKREKLFRNQSLKKYDDDAIGFLSEEAKEQALNLTGLAVNKKSIIEN